MKDKKFPRKPPKILKVGDPVKPQVVRYPENTIKKIGPKKK